MNIDISLSQAAGMAMISALLLPTLFFALRYEAVRGAILFTVVVFAISAWLYAGLHLIGVE